MTTQTSTKTKWDLDPAHSEIEFKVKHLMITNVTGHFGEYSATLESGKDDFSDAVGHLLRAAHVVKTGANALMIGLVLVLARWGLGMQGEAFAAANPFYDCGSDFDRDGNPVSVYQCESPAAIPTGSTPPCAKGCTSSKTRSSQGPGARRSTSRTCRSFCRI